MKTGCDESAALLPANCQAPPLGLVAQIGTNFHRLEPING
jgi:hypothetical protein